MSSSSAASLRSEALSAEARSFVALIEKCKLDLDIPDQVCWHGTCCYCQRAAAIYQLCKLPMTHALLETTLVGAKLSALRHLSGHLGATLRCALRRWYKLVRASGTINAALIDRRIDELYTLDARVDCSSHHEHQQQRQEQPGKERLHRLTQRETSTQFERKDPQPNSEAKLTELKPRQLSFMEALMSGDAPPKRKAESPLRSAPQPKQQKLSPTTGPPVTAKPRVFKTTEPCQQSAISPQLNVLPTPPLTPEELIASSSISPATLLPLAKLPTPSVVTSSSSSSSASSLDLQKSAASQCKNTLSLQSNAVSPDLNLITPSSQHHAKTASSSDASPVEAFSDATQKRERPTPPKRSASQTPSPPLRMAMTQLPKCKKPTSLMRKTMRMAGRKI